jgi:NADH:ubiquinone oxidoreductase subunit 5 (subunit L)/multisubunit Na+/H+ antiporter MnhA subunit
MYISIIGIPLMSAMIAGLLGRYIGTRVTKIITSLSIVLSFILSLMIFYEVLLNQSVTYINVFT